MDGPGRPLTVDPYTVAILRAARRADRPGLIADIASDPDPSRRVAIAFFDHWAWNEIPDEVLERLAADPDARVRLAAAAVAAERRRGDLFSEDEDWRVRARAMSYCMTHTAHGLPDEVLEQHRTLADAVARADLDPITADAPPDILTADSISGWQPAVHVLECIARSAALVMIDPRTGDPLPAARLMHAALYATRVMHGSGNVGQHSTHHEQAELLSGIEELLTDVEPKRRQQLRRLLHTVPRRRHR